MRAEFFISQLQDCGINAYYGVPDSLLKSICAYFTDNVDEQCHIITANEGNAIGLACGHYLATSRPALVYMQNSGQGNCVNPLLSLMDPEVYSIPVLMLIGWRGEPGIKDEPQHVKQGLVTLQLLETMGIEYAVLSADEAEAAVQINEAVAYMKQNVRPYAFVAQKNTFDVYLPHNKCKNDVEMSREEAICAVVEMLSSDDIVVGTTGQISRELYEFRERNGSGHYKDFLTVGAMGHSSSIAMGIALSRPERRIICMDGDGAFLMHMGACAVIGNSGLVNFRHIVLNNSAHDSVGGQPTVAGKMDLGAIAKACGYCEYYRVSTINELVRTMPVFLNAQGTSMLEIIVKCGSRVNLGRPKESPAENKRAFMEFVEEGRSLVYPGAFAELSQIVRKRGWKRILLFCSQRCRNYLRSQINEQLSDCDIVHYSSISPNPTAESVSVALNVLNERIDAIIAIGGGSVIDFAKLYRISKDNKIDIAGYFKHKRELIRRTPLVAVPTTSGTGSEATRFAVVYIEGEKYSLDAAPVMPDYALVDAKLMLGAPRYLKASCGMDALAQAMEGFWALGATSESDVYARRALKLCCENIIQYVNSDSSVAAAAMAEGAYLAGKCINIARTTAAHAISYKITQRYGIPHGHAVALTLPALAELHYYLAQSSEVMMLKMNELLSIIGVGEHGIRQWLYNLYDSIGLEYRFELLGIIDTDAIINGVNEERMCNNPFTLNKKQLKSLFV